MEEKKLTGYPSIDKPWLKYYSEEAINAPLPEGTIYENILNNNKDYFDNIAINYYGCKITYRKLFDNVDACAKALRCVGVIEGDCVNMCTAGVPEAIYIVLAASKIGAIANFINPMFSEQQIVDRINDTGASTLFVLDKMYSFIANAINTTCLKQVVVISATSCLPASIRIVSSIKGKNPLLKSDMKSRKYKSWKQFISLGNSCHTRQTDATYKKGTPVVMVYSSGTTGASKGIVLTNDGINAIIAHYSIPDCNYERGNTFLQMIPVWFSTGIVLSVLMPLCLGVTVIPEPVFSKESFAKDLTKYSPNMTLTATSLWKYAIHCEELASTNLSQLIYPTTGGEQILPDTENEINDFLCGHGCSVKLIKGYGMCELGSTISTTSIKHSKLGSVGYPIYGATVAAFDMETDKELTYGMRGEIRVDSPARMKEYYKNPEATNNFFHTDSNGTVWGCTGDIGYVDEDGDVFILGRATDCYYTKDGTRVYQFDIENVLLQDNAISDCEVVQTLDKKVVAHIIIKEDCIETQANIIARLNKRCSEQLDAYAVPTHYKFRTDFPVHSNGKRDSEALRKDLDELIIAKQAVSPSPPSARSITARWRK